MSDFAILPHIIPCVVYENLTKHKTEDFFLYMAVVGKKVIRELTSTHKYSILTNRINKIVKINALDLVI